MLRRRGISECSARAALDVKIVVSSAALLLSAERFGEDGADPKTSSRVFVGVMVEGGVVSSLTGVPFMKSWESAEILGPKGGRSRSMTVPCLGAEITVRDLDSGVRVLLSVTFKSLKDGSMQCAHA